MSDVLDAVRKNYPQYATVPDDELALRIGSKFPQYLQRSSDFKLEYDRAAVAGVKLTSTQRDEMAAGPVGNREDFSLAVPPAMNPNNDFVKAVGEDPKQFIESLPAIALGAAAIPGKVAYYQAADAVSKLFNEPEYGGNIAALEKGEDTLPVEKFISQTAKTNPNLAVAAKLGQAATELAPSLGLAAAPAAVNRLLAAGFSASMIASAPKLFDAYADEINKPEDEQDAGKLADLKSQMIQTFVFAPLAGAGAAGRPTARGDVHPTVEASPEARVQSPESGAEPVQTGGRVEPPVQSPKSTVPSPSEIPETPPPADQAPVKQTPPEAKGDVKGDAVGDESNKQAVVTDATTLDEQPVIGTVPTQAEVTTAAKKARTKPEAKPEPRRYNPLAKDAVPARSFETAQTGQPFQMRLLRGQGRPDSPYSEFVPQEPILGKGLWTTPSREYAESFGKNITEHDVDIKKPLVIRTDEQWRSLIREAGWKYANPFGQDLAATQKNIRDIRSLIESKGHDGVVIDPSQSGDEAKVLWDVFGERQAVEFKAEKPPRIEGMGLSPRLETPADRADRATRTTIRATEQKAEPQLQEAGQQLLDLSGGRVEGMASSPRSTVQSPKSQTSAAAPPIALSGAPPVAGLSKFASLLNAPDPKAPGRAMQLIVRAYLGKEYGQIRSMDAAFKTFKNYFDKSPKPRDYVYQPGDELAGKMPKGWQVQWAIDSGNTASLTPAEQNFAKAYRAAMDWAIGVVQEVSPESLRDLYQDYFGRIWKDPEKNANVIRQWINSRPLEGSKSFLKERVLKDWIDGVKMGLEPLSDNPVDMMLYKAGEMIQFAGARMMKQEAKVLGLRKFFYLSEKMPDGWRVDPDKRGEAFAPPVVTLKEAFDAQVRAKTLEMFQKLGIPQSRLAKLRGGAWGLAYETGQRVETKFGGADFVFWHEFGHIMDFRYADLRPMLGLTKAARSATDVELRALADLRGGRPNYTHKAEEKMANVFDAYIRAPDLFQKTAPTVWAGLNKWLDLHPDVKVPLNEIRPSLKIGTGTTDLQLAGPVLLGHWAMPEQAVRVMENFQGQSLLKGRKSVAGLRAVNGLLTSARLFGFFHGGMVTNDSFYGGLSLILNDALHGKFSPSEAAKNLMMVPRAFMLGGKVRRAIEAPGTVSAVNQDLAKYSLEANLRSHIGTYDMSMGRRWKRAANELLSAPSAGAAWETFWRTPFAAMAATMHPVMDGLVPRMKYGMNGLQVMRILQDGPTPRELTADELFERPVQIGATPAMKALFRAKIEGDLNQRLEFRDKLAKSADSVEDRIGQVTYDNLFLNKTLKDASTLGLTAFGWHLTKYRGVFGAATDWARAATAVARGQKPEVTFRMTYLPAMVMGHAIIGATLQYVLTGKPPKSLQDYLFPESGLVDAYGKPIRLAIADYVKDIAGDINAFRFHGVHGEVDRQVARLAPVWNMAAEMYRNKDFWGNQIFSQQMPNEPEMEHLLKNLGEGAKYLAGSSAPFTARTGGKLQEAGAGTFASYAAPFIGVVPAPREATLTASQALADEISAGRAPTSGRTPDQATKAQAIAQVVKDVRLGKINDERDFEARERSAGVTSKQQETAIKQRVLWTPYQRQVWLMPLDDAMRVWDLASEQEKLQLVKFRPGSDEGLAQKVQKAAASGRLDETVAKRYVMLLLPYWQRAAAQPVHSPQSTVQRQRFSAVTP